MILQLISADHRPYNKPTPKYPKGFIDCYFKFFKPDLIMKIFKSFFVLALMALTLNVSAANDVPNGEMRLKSKVVEQNVLVVQLYNLQQAKTKIKIQSLDGKTTFFSDFVNNHNGYIRKINLENLTDGRYKIQVEQNDQSRTQVVLVRGSKVQLSSVNQG